MCCKIEHLCSIVMNYQSNETIASYIQKRVENCLSQAKSSYLYKSIIFKVEFQYLKNVHLTHMPSATLPDGSPLPGWST